MCESVWVSGCVSLFLSHQGIVLLLVPYITRCNGDYIPWRLVARMGLRSTWSAGHSIWLSFTWLEIQHVVLPIYNTIIKTDLLCIRLLLLHQHNNQPPCNHTETRTCQCSKSSVQACSYMQHSQYLHAALRMYTCQDCEMQLTSRNQRGRVHCVTFGKSRVSTNTQIRV